MRVIHADSVEEAYEEALWLMQMCGEEQDTRNGKAMVAPFPVVTQYAHPERRMLYNVKRDANPFFHVIEAMWMLAGRNEVKVVSDFAAHLKTFSDDGVTLNGAYGYRWRQHFEIDQLMELVVLLKTDPNTRRAVLAMWDGAEDLANTSKSKDVPCNTHIYFQIQNGKLDMTVCNRSNDIVWGCYGANVVHMSFLQEFMALAVDVPMGTYYQFSNNWHIYERHYDLLGTLPGSGRITHYNFDVWNHVPLFNSGGDGAWFLSELEDFIHHVGEGDVSPGYRHEYIHYVLRPLVRSYWAHKRKDTPWAITLASGIKDTAVSAACVNWLTRRLK